MVNPIPLTLNIDGDSKSYIAYEMNTHISMNQLLMCESIMISRLNISLK